MGGEEGNKNLINKVSATKSIWNVLLSVGLSFLVLLGCFLEECPQKLDGTIQSDENNEWKEWIFSRVFLACILALTALSERCSLLPCLLWTLVLYVHVLWERSSFFQFGNDTFRHFG